MTAHTPYVQAHKAHLVTLTKLDYVCIPTHQHHSEDLQKYHAVCMHALQYNIMAPLQGT